MNEMNREMNTKVNKNVMEMDRMTERIAFVQEGLLYLMKTMTPYIPSEQHALQLWLKQKKALEKENGEEGDQAATGNDTTHLNDLSSLDEMNEIIPSFEVPPSNDSDWLNKGLWTPLQSTEVFNKLEAYLEEMTS